MSNAMAIVENLIDEGITFSQVITAMMECGQNNPHHYGSVWEHSLDVSLYFPDKTRILQIIGLLHDCAKPFVKVTSNGRDHFYGHEEASAKLTKYLIETDADLTDYENDVEFICKMIRHHNLGMIMTVKGDDHLIKVNAENLQTIINDYKLNEYELKTLLLICEADIMAQARVAVTDNGEVTRNDKLEILNAIHKVMQENDLQYCE